MKGVVLHLSGECVFHWRNHLIGDAIPPDRREPLGGGAHPATGRRHPGTTRPTPADWTTRRPAGLGGTPGPGRPPALRSRPRATPDHHHAAHRTRPDLPAALATDGVPASHRATPRRTPLRVQC